MELNSLPEIVFVDADKNKVEEAVLGEYESITGRTSPGATWCGSSS